MKISGTNRADESMMFLHMWHDFAGQFNWTSRNNSSSIFIFLTLGFYAMHLHWWLKS